MNQKELMLQGGLAKAKTHTITVGHSHNSEEYTDSYGFIGTVPPLGNIIPKTFLQTKILSVYSYQDGGAYSTNVLLQDLYLVVDTIRITRLDTAESILVPSKGEGSLWYITSGGIFFPSDTGKTIDLIIEAV